MIDKGIVKEIENALLTSNTTISRQINYSVG